MNAAQIRMLQEIDAELTDIEESVKRRGAVPKKQLLADISRIHEKIRNFLNTQEPTLLA